MYVTYFDSFGVNHVPKEPKTFIWNKNIKTNIFRIEAYDSIICEYFCIRFIGFMFAGKTLTDFTNMVSPNNFQKNWWCNSKLYYDQRLKMVEREFHEMRNAYPNLSAISLSNQ